jgi:hypothetical protein
MAQIQSALSLNRDANEMNPISSSRFNGFAE